ncbi:MAG: oxidoreductase [Lachnospiraceae bacterium]|nr:oxidoreductase [Lachnospiraceae bacterium]
MKEAYRILPVYAGDVSGVASALYELGGMVVMHDPSGCNSTYNTHDEVRWYRKESYIFISGLNTRDAVLGNDKKFMDDIVAAATGLSPAPKFIALCNSPIPFLNGTDFKGIARLLEKRLQIPVFYVKTNGMHDYVDGAGRAFSCFAQKLLPADKRLQEERVVPADPSAPVKINLLGLTPLDFADYQNVENLKEHLKKAGFDVVANWSYGTCFEDVMQSGKADVNLVLSATGLPLAKTLQNMYGQPYVAGLPLGSLSEEIYRQLRLAAAGEDFCTFPAKETPSVTGQTNGKTLYLIGEALQCKSLGYHYVADRGFRRAVVLCPLEQSEELISSTNGDILTVGEEQIEEYFKDMKNTEILCDPMYEPVLPADAKIWKYPSLSFSGRIFGGHFPVFF